VVKIFFKRLQKTLESGGYSKHNSRQVEKRWHLSLSRHCEEALHLRAGVAIENSPKTAVCGMVWIVLGLSAKHGWPKANYHKLLGLKPWPPRNDG
jgi:hypothetical protein